MRNIRLSRSNIVAVAAISIATLLVGTQLPAVAGNDNRTPDVPTTIRPGDTNKVHFHVYAVGVQIYNWSGSAWVFRAPEAVLFDADGNVVGIHYAGPTWESESGSKVVGARIASASSPNPQSIPLLLLGAVTTEGPGIFERTTFIQRVNTVGGVAPSVSGSTIGEEARVPYTAEYFFYRDAQ